MALGRLVQRIKGQPTPGMTEGLLAWRFPLLDQQLHQPLQGPGQFPTQAFCLKGLLSVELKAIGQAEASQKIAPGQGHSFD